jgi:hypothetical protein
VCIITSTHFAAEAYPSNPGPALVLVVGVKNIVSFGQSRLRFENSLQTYNQSTDIRIQQGLLLAFSRWSTPGITLPLTCW